MNCRAVESNRLKSWRVMRAARVGVLLIEVSRRIIYRRAGLNRRLEWYRRIELDPRVRLCGPQHIYIYIYIYVYLYIFIPKIER